MRRTLVLNIISLGLGLAGAALAAYPVFAPFHGQKLADVTVDMTTVPDTPAFRAWQERADSFGRRGLLLVALGTIAGAAAQVLEATARRRPSSVLH